MAIVTSSGIFYQAEAYLDGVMSIAWRELRRCGMYKYTGFY